jgi:hypothetical protein
MAQLSQLFKIVKPQTASEKKTRTVVDTIMVTPNLLDKWKSPPFQRPVRENEKVRTLAEEMKQDGGVWPGIITLGMLDGQCYLMDGQHRKAAFLLSGVAEGYTDVRTHYFASMADMGEEFVRLNSQLVRMRPDDILRGLEPSIEGLRKIRHACPFVGYDYIRRGEKAPVVSMSVVIRAWRGSNAEVPSPNGGGMSGAMMVTSMTEQDFDDLIGFLQLAVVAFGRDSQYARLWSNLNLIMCMWLYRRLVLDPVREPQVRFQPVPRDIFKKGMMSVSAATEYVDWLLGRHIGERDRAPAYSRLKAIFAERFAQELGRKVKLPSPPWSR